MANETEIRPALTPEEWSEPQIDRSDLHVHLAGDGLLVAYTPGDRSTLAMDEDRHALAALALYGQPFGFTREDVEKLRAMPDAVLDESYQGSYASIDDGAWFRSLIARIAALLPPE